MATDMSKKVKVKIESQKGQSKLSTMIKLEISYPADVHLLILSSPLSSYLFKML